MTLVFCFCALEVLDLGSYSYIRRYLFVALQLCMSECCFRVIGFQLYSNIKCHSRVVISRLHLVAF